MAHVPPQSVATIDIDSGYNLKLLSHEPLCPKYSWR